MSIRTVVTRGYASGSAVAEVVVRGYAAEAAGGAAGTDDLAWISVRRRRMQMRQINPSR